MNKSLTVVLFICVFFSLLLLSNNRLPFFSQASGFVEAIFSVPKSLLFSMASLSSNNQALQQENQKLQEKVAQFENMKTENQALRSQFMEQKIDSQKLLPAKVIGFEGSALAPTLLIINKGADDGLKKNMTIVSGKNLVGAVDLVMPHFSSIMLLTNPSFSALGKTAEDNTLGVLQGEGDFILLTNVVITDQVSKGDLVITRGDINKSGIGIYPDLIVGKIRTINKKASESFQEAEIQPIIDYSRLTTVYILFL